MPTIIRDPIHNYIPISHLETLLIEDPLFQRLRYITQNGLAHSVYPSNRTSRFLHSLGVMHVGGQMFRHAIENSSDEDRKAVWTSAHDLIEGKLREPTLYATREKLAKYVSDRNEPFYREYGFDPQDEKDLDKIILLQSLRLACVMHDLGHFPFSHTVEVVLSDFASASATKPKRKGMRSAFESLRNDGGEQPLSHLHECIGRVLTRYVFSGFQEAAAKEFACFCFSIAEEIASSEGQGPLRRSLHSIVSGNLDADRCDYVRRDGSASAFEFGDFDLARILHSLRFHKTKGGNLEIVPTTVALSALEAFFLERYRLWRWLVFHHTAIALDLALSRALTILLEVACNELSGKSYEEIRMVLKDSGFSRLWESFRDKNDYSLFVACDEPWLLTVLRRVQSTLPKLDGGVHMLREQLALRAYLDLVLDRKKRLRPFWKRQEVYANFCEHVVKGLKLKKKKGQNSVERFNEKVFSRLSKLKASSEVTRMRIFEDNVQTELKKVERDHVGVLARRLSFKPWEDPPKVLDPDKDKEKLILLKDLSIIVRNLPRMWGEDMQLRMYYWFRESIAKNMKQYRVHEGGTPPSISQLATAFANALREYDSA